METRGHGLVTVELLCNYCAREGCVSHADEQQCATPREQIRSKSKLKKGTKTEGERREYMVKRTGAPAFVSINYFNVVRRRNNSFRDLLLFVDLFFLFFFFFFFFSF